MIQNSDFRCVGSSAQAVSFQLSLGAAESLACRDPISLSILHCVDIVACFSAAQVGLGENVLKRPNVDSSFEGFQFPHQGPKTRLTVAVVVENGHGNTCQLIVFIITKRT